MNLFLWIPFSSKTWLCNWHRLVYIFHTKFGIIKIRHSQRLIRNCARLGSWSRRVRRVGKGHGLPGSFEGPIFKTVNTFIVFCFFFLVIETLRLDQVLRLSRQRRFLLLPTAMDLAGRLRQAVIVITAVGV